MIITAVYDRKAECYQYPMCFRNVVDAARAFESAVRDENQQLGKFRNDYEIHECGEFDEQTGIVEPRARPLVIARGIDFDPLLQKM